MDEEMKLLLDSLQVSPEDIPQVSISGGQKLAEKELTDDIRRAKPVVNTARNGSRVRNATSFLSNPEVQNALISFGQAFSNAGNFTGQPNPIDVIGEAGRARIRSNADLEALRAFEEGRPIAGSTNRFANPELIAGLQARRQQGELAQQELTAEQQQFRESINLQERQTKLQEDKFRVDTVLQRAAQRQDAEQFNARFELLEREQTVSEQLADAREQYWDRLGRAALLREEDGGGNVQDLLLRTEKFLGLLGEQEQLQEQLLTQTDQEIDRLEEELMQRAENRPTFGQVTDEMSLFGSPLGASTIERLTRENVQGAEELQSLQRQREDIVSQINDIRNQKKLARQVQAANLGLGSAEGEGGTDATGEQQTGEQTRETGSRENPLDVTITEMGNLPDGSIVRNPLDDSEIGEIRNGRFIPLPEQELEEEDE